MPADNPMVVQRSSARRDVVHDNQPRTGRNLLILTDLHNQIKSAMNGHFNVIKRPYQCKAFNV